MRFVLDTDHISLQFHQLHQQRLRIGTQDLRIAAIALANGCILITRNRRDFERAPGLGIEIGLLRR
jgi:tRNA(fMet)-specific endonuclease VapC